ncbi:hypothetical protein Vretifemale_7499 [Volvox reticuliferus]|nr:hypothetical protein Vretifemale_7499 [Volvox reticuliferus]
MMARLGGVRMRRQLLSACGPLLLLGLTCALDFAGGQSAQGGIPSPWDSFGAGTRGGQVTDLRCNILNPKAFVVQVYVTYGEVVNYIAVLCNDYNYFEAGLDGDGNRYTFTDLKGFIAMRADSLNPDPTRLAFRLYNKVWNAGPAKLPVGSNTQNGSDLRSANCPAAATAAVTKAAATYRALTTAAAAATAATTAY